LSLRSELGKPGLNLENLFSILDPLCFNSLLDLSLESMLRFENLVLDLGFIANKFFISVVVSVVTGTMVVISTFVNSSSVSV